MGECRQALPALVSGAAQLGIHLDAGQQTKFLKYCEILQDANQTLNLTGVRTAPGIMKTLFLDSLTLALALPLESGGARHGMRRLVDVGSGAGLPGIPLRIAFPHWSLTLVESIGKKAHFLRTVTESLALDRVEVQSLRAEELGRSPIFRDSADICIARAVAALPALCELCSPFVVPGGLLAFPKSGDVDCEVARGREAARALHVSIRSLVPVPESLGLGTGRVIAVYEKTGKTPDRFPRRVGLAASQPIGDSKARSEAKSNPAAGQL